MDPPLPVSYHGYVTTTRELLFALPGLSLTQDKPELIDKVLQYLFAKLDEGLLPQNYPDQPTEDKDQAADNSLLLINFLYFYYTRYKVKKMLANKAYTVCTEIIEAFNKGTRHNIYCDEDGLLFTGDKDTPVSWMPLELNSDRHTRYGKLLEINALWYNALKIMEYFSRELKKNRLIKKYAALANQTRSALLASFWDDKESQFSDVIRAEYRNNSFTINQLYLVGLPFSPLDAELGQQLLQLIATNLYTDYGLRSLSKLDEFYEGTFSSEITREEVSYYRGAVLTWMTGLYMDALLSFEGESQQIIDFLTAIIDRYKAVFYDKNMYVLPEILSAEPPHLPNGSSAYLPAETEILRCLLHLEELNT
jgi:predicted glycogen debranching enzyme